eukprot:6104067-Prymnesium_polylepis.1
MSPRSHSTAGRRMWTRLTRGEQPAYSQQCDLSRITHSPHSVSRQANLAADIRASRSFVYRCHSCRLYWNLKNVTEMLYGIP